MRMSFMATCAAACLLVAVPQLASAQTAAPAATALDTSNDTGATPAKLALVHRMLDAMHFQTMMQQVMGQMTPGLVAGLRKSNPQLSDADADKMQKVMAITGEVMNDYMPKLVDSMAEVYAEVFTTDELTAMDNFYESAAGQSMLAKTPQVMAKIMPVMGDLMPSIMADTQKRVCAEIGCSNGDKAGGKS